MEAVMPVVRVTMRQGRSADYRKAILNGVHDALVESFEIPEQDRHQQLIQLPPEDFEIPSSQTDAHTLIELTVFPGRSLEAKKKLYQGIVRKLAQDPGIAPTDVLIVLHEPPLENWGIRGGQAATDVNIGFELDV
jgi:phenylpyruvate tautomerase PptA (4-oxalocrotonate tautomerase family)